MNFIETFFLCFIPLFVAMDVLGVVPIFLSMTSGLTETRRRKLITEATMAALVISVIFLFTGKFVFTFLGITEDDFRIAGGLVLLTFAIRDLLFSPEERRRGISSHASAGAGVGAVPIGIPLIMGPAALTTILILVDNFGYIYTMVSLLVNLAVVWIVFRQSKYIIRVIGDAGAKGFAKVASLFIAAIAIMMIRVGLTNFWKSASF